MPSLVSYGFLLPTAFSFIDVNLLKAVPKQRLLGIYTSILINDNETTTQDVHFARAMQVKAEHDGIPNHVINAIIHQMTTADENDKSTWENCPAGDCDVPVTLESIWGYRVCRS